MGRSWFIEVNIQQRPELSWSVMPFTEVVYLKKLSTGSAEWLRARALMLLFWTRMFWSAAVGPSFTKLDWIWLSSAGVMVWAQTVAQISSAGNNNIFFIMVQS